MTASKRRHPAPTVPLTPPFNVHSLSGTELFQELDDPHSNTSKCVKSFQVAKIIRPTTSASPI